MKKILIVSVSAGNGHTRAAAALKKAADLFYPQIISEHVDFLNFVGPTSKKIFFESYDLMTKNLPILYKILFEMSDNQTGAKILEKITTLNKNLNTEKFQKYIENYSPHAIIFTHFTPAEIFNTFNNTIPSATVITDYEKHRLWFTGNQQKYFVAQTGIKNELVALGVAENNVIVSGIPIDPDFYQPMNDQQKEIKKMELRIANDKKIIAILPSGQGKINPIKLAKKILQENDTVILALGGKNKKLLQQYKKINSENIKIVGWTDKISEYLQLADLIITKPGGLTVSECLALNKPMLLINPIPGQEEKNLNHVVSTGLGAILEDENLWLESWNKIKKVKRPIKLPIVQAANIILDNVLKII